MKFVIVFLILFPCTVFAQEVKKFEFEAAIGPNFGVENKSGANIQESINIILELRHNYNRRIDFGIQFLIGTYDVVYKTGNSLITYRNMILQPIADYNFRQGKNVTPFVGAGFGVAIIDMDYIENTDKSICFTPRLGAEFFRHLRLTLDYRLLKQDFSFWNCTIGAVFGGGKKKINKSH